jgi:hypothetical protein
MKLHLMAAALAGGILWGLVVLLTAVANIHWTGYGSAFLQGLASLYPGYHASGSSLDLLTGVFYALVDGAVGGFVLAWLYNQFASLSSHRHGSR